MGAKAIQLIQQLQHGPLHLTISLLLTGKPLQQQMNQPQLNVPVHYIHTHMVHVELE